MSPYSHAGWRRALSLLLAAALATGPLHAARANEEPGGALDETFTFAQLTAAALDGNIEGTKISALKARTVPVTTSGAYTHRIPLLLPPGRAGLTPSLALEYSSERFRRESEVGTGWTLTIPRILRSTRDGFPKVVFPEPPAAPTYHAPSARFEGPAGVLVPIASGPGTGSHFAPEREKEPVRYAFDMASDSWTEHLPSGLVRYYGRDPVRSTSARVVSELGTFAWYLVREEDRRGNSIDYDYWFAEDAGRVDRRKAQRAPIVKAIRWGGNSQHGVAHAFEVTSILNDIPDLAPDLLQGNTVVAAFVDTFQVFVKGQPTGGFYSLQYEPSPDSGRLLLSRISRGAPGEDTTHTTLSYSGNDGPPTFSDWFALPIEPETWAYWFGIFDSDERRKYCSKNDALDPPRLRPATRLVDFDGDALMDAVYHAGRLNVGRVGIGWENSRRQNRTPAGPLLGFGAMNSANYGFVTDDVDTQLADLDGDRDVDGLEFVDELVDADGNSTILGGLSLWVTGADLTEICCSHDFWNECGNIDPAPPMGHDNTWSWEDELGEIPPGPPRQAPPNPSPVGPAPINPRPSGKKYGCLPLVEECINNPDYGHCPGGPDLPPVPNPYLDDVPTWVAPRIEESTSVVLHLNSSRTQPELSPLDHWAEDQLPPSPRLQWLYGWPHLVRQRTVIETVPAGCGLFPGPSFRTISTSDFIAPVVDLNADGRPDLTLLKYWSRPDGNNSFFKMVPRAYVADGMQWNFDYPSMTRPRFSAFSETLIAALGGGHAGPCIGIECASAKYPPKGTDFTAQFMDVNGDGLPDLLVARPPSPMVENGLPVCWDGHQVLLNRGYRFDLGIDDTVDHDSHRWSPQQAGIPFPGAFDIPPQDTEAGLSQHPFLLLRNRGQRCTSEGLNDFGGPTAPPQGMAEADVNGDGRVDLVFAYSRALGANAAAAASTQPPQSAYVFLNTSRGFARAGDAGFPSNFETFESELPIPIAVINGPEGEGLLKFSPVEHSDLLRFTDMDGDGLVDIVQAGLCEAASYWDPAPVCARPILWKRNLGVVPDLLTHVNEHSGAWTEIDYVTASSPEATSSLFTDPPIVTEPEGELLDVSSGQMVVRRIARSAGANIDPAKAAPVETVRLRYFNFGRDLYTREPIGFEKVTATFIEGASNEFLEVEEPIVTVTQSFDTTDLMNDYEGQRIPHFHPLRGHLVSTETVAGEHSILERNSYFLTHQDDGASEHGYVRIRPLDQHIRMCDVAGCVWRGKRNDPGTYDEFGYPGFSQAGDSNGCGVLGCELTTNERLVSTTTEYQHDVAAWQLGFVTSREVRGYRELIDGTALADAVLSLESATYANGLLHTTTRPGVTPAECAGPSDDVITYDYWPIGLLRSVSYNGRREIEQSFDTDWLYPTTQSVEVERFVGGVGTGTMTTIEESYEYDLRTGKETRRIDANGSSWESEYDSRGRLLTKLGPSGVLLESRSYDDAPPVTLTATIFTEDSALPLLPKTYTRKERLDGWGRVIGVVQGSPSTGYDRLGAVEYDALGRMVRAYLPRTASDEDDHLVLPGEKSDLSEYDGLDRRIRFIRADGKETTWTHGPDFTEMVSPRGTHSRQEFDWRGSIVRQIKYLAPGNLGTAAIVEFVRDGLGRVNRVVDADGFVRNLELDSLGRVRMLNLPHSGPAATDSTDYCYDLDGKITSVVTPAGRAIDIQSDGLGRPVLRTANFDGVTKTVYYEYDDPAPGKRALGRLSLVSDAFGVTRHEYDDFGRRSLVSYTLSQDAKAGFAWPNVHNSYEVSLAYNLTSQLKRVDYVSSDLVMVGSVIYERDDLGRPSAVKDGITNQAIADQFGYTPDGRMTDASFVNGASAAWAFDPDSRLLNDIVYFNSATWTELGSVHYEYDDNDNVTDEIRGAGPYGVLTSKLHDYDAWDRLIETQWSTGLAARVETYAYSRGNNIASADGQTYQYGLLDNQHAVSSVTKAGRVRTLAYGPDGNLETDVDTDGPTVHTKEIHTDPVGCTSRVEAATTLNGAPVATTNTDFVCGHEGTALVRKSSHNGVPSARIDLGGMAEVRPHDGVLLLRIPINGTVAIEDARSLANGLRQNAKSGILFSDLRSSVLARASITAPANSFAQEVEYDSWGGDLLVSANPRPAYGFVGKDYTPGLGSYYIGSRVYDPSLRRWLSVDPYVSGAPEHGEISDADLNLYAYSGNNPAKYVDSTGHFLETAWDIASLAQGVASIASWDSSTSTSQKVADVLGVVADTAAVVMPGIPGGASVAIKAATVAGGGVAAAGMIVKGPSLADVANAAEAIADAGSTARTVDKAADAGKAGAAGGGVADGAVVCRGGTCTAERFANGSGVTIDSAGRLQGVSVNTGQTLEAASAGIPNGQVGATTAGQIRAAGGDVVASPTPRNSNHATMSGLTPEQAEKLFTPTVSNPSRAK